MSKFIVAGRASTKFPVILQHGYPLPEIPIHTTLKLPRATHQRETHRPSLFPQRSPFTDHQQNPQRQRRGKSPPPTQEIPTTTTIQDTPPLPPTHQIPTTLWGKHPITHSTCKSVHAVSVVRGIEKKKITHHKLSTTLQRKIVLRTVKSRARLLPRPLSL